MWVSETGSPSWELRLETSRPINVRDVDGTLESVDAVPSHSLPSHLPKWNTECEVLVNSPVGTEPVLLQKGNGE